MDRPSPPKASGNAGTWTAFLICAFVVVGLMGLFASYGPSLPLARALARDAALDEVLAAAHGPNPQAAIEALRDRLGDSAAALLPADSGLEARIGAERAAMRTRLSAEAAEVAVRTRWMVCVITVMAAAFGAAILRVSRRG